MTKVAIYSRVSTSMQVEKGHSLHAQKERLTEYAERNEWEVFDYYVDEGLSGRHANRPDFKRLLKDAAARKFDIVLIWKISRLSRSILDLNNTINIFMKSDVSLVSYSENFDLRTPVGKLMFNILGSFAEFERETIAENIIFGMRGAAERGTRLISFMFGYKYENHKFIIDEKSAAIVRELFDLYIEKQNRCEVVRIVNAKGYRTFYGREFTPGGVRMILSNVSYLGYLKYKNEIVFKEKVLPQIVDESVFDRVQEILIARSIQYSKPSSNQEHTTNIKRLSEWLGNDADEHKNCRLEVY